MVAGECGWSSSLLATKPGPECIIRCDVVVFRI